MENDMVKFTPVYKNRQLVDVMVELKMIDMVGLGIKNDVLETAR